MIKYDELKSKPKDFIAVTGLNIDEFLHLLPAFDLIYRENTSQFNMYGKPRKRKSGAGVTGALPRSEDKLLFILVYQKGCELQTFLALQFGISQPQANYWIHRLLPFLLEAMKFY